MGWFAAGMEGMMRVGMLTLWTTFMYIGRHEGNGDCGNKECADGYDEEEVEEGQLEIQMKRVTTMRSAEK